VISSIAEHFDLPTNRLYQVRDDFLHKRIPFVDLVSGNVNTQGITFPKKLLQRAMAAGIRGSRIYHPNPLGQPVARQAVSRLYASEKHVIPSDQILMTPGTSVSYWYAFKLLADAGDEILTPSPSYPLFDSIASLSGVKLTSYRLRERARWEIDFSDLEAAITPRTKAVVLISPHNPTGAVATSEEVQRLGEIAARRNLAIISDEVFSSFLYDLKELPRPLTTSAPLVLTMNGLSKMLALPGMKIGWMIVTGDPSLVRKAMKTLEMISDTFLSVNEGVQLALPQILGKCAVFQKSYGITIQDRRAKVIKVLEQRPEFPFVRPEGGFFLTIRLKDSGVDEEELAIRLLQKRRLLVHPGYFYDMERQHLVFNFVGRRVRWIGDLLDGIDEIGR
jgi:aspartate/methionine/tyrosine aminotransferase